MEPKESQKLKEYYLKKLSQAKDNKDKVPVYSAMPEEKFLSSAHESEDDSIRNIIEENDDVY